MSEQVQNENGLPIFYLAIKDRETLAKLYMPFVRNGGLFIPTSRCPALGSQVFLALKLMNEPIRHPVCATVIWITPEKAQGGRVAGIGVRFSDPDNQVKHRITNSLA
jgi:type IV pilus assembly protein PilZ